MPASLQPSAALAEWRGDEPVATRAAEARERLLARVVGLADLERRRPLAPVAARLAEGYDPARSYGQLKGLLAAERDALGPADAALSRGYGLLLLLHLIDTHAARWPAARLHPGLEPDIVDSHHRIAAAAARGGNAALDIGADTHAKDVAICLYRIVPVGGRLLDLGSGVPRRLMLSETPSRRPGTLLHMLRCGGFTPFAEFHVHSHMRHRFTPEAWRYCFERLPLLFASRPRLRGVFGIGWFFDPALARISPSLDFVREIVLDWGARLVHAGAGPDATANALAMSPERQALHEAGRYTPTGYAMILPKRAVLRRARLSR